jgi:hypothetical protein
MLYVNQVYIGKGIMLSLQNVMRANAISCISFGVLFALQPSLVAMFLGGEFAAPQLYILILGILLIFNGFHLFWASKIALPKKELILYFSLGDYIWVVVSLALVMFGVWITTTMGTIVACAVAAVVGLLGILQMIARKSLGHC